MNESVYQAGKELFKTRNLPVSKTDIKRLRRRQRSRLLVWEWALNSLLIHSRGVWQDIRIMLKTIPAVLFVRGRINREQES
jgi:lipopolysaccharide/colanic/teichoic acid biosynthesis glycosyltransferase